MSLGMRVNMLVVTLCQSNYMYFSIFLILNLDILIIWESFLSECSPRLMDYHHNHDFWYTCKNVYTKSLNT
jgi:hypothetical protein